VLNRERKRCEKNSIREEKKVKVDKCGEKKRKKRLRLRKRTSGLLNVAAELNTTKEEVGGRRKYQSGGAIKKKGRPRKGGATYVPAKRDLARTAPID